MLKSQIQKPNDNSQRNLIVIKHFHHNISLLIFRLEEIGFVCDDIALSMQAIRNSGAVKNKRPNRGSNHGSRAA